MSLLWLFNTLNTQSVILIPFSKQGENKQLIIEEDRCYRTFETLVKSYFLKQEQFQLIDFLTTYKNAKQAGIHIPNSTTGVIEKLIQFAHPDIYIVADMSNGIINGEYIYRINLAATWTSTGETLSATALDSGFRKFQDCDLLIKKTMQNRNMEDTLKMKVFIQTMKGMMPDVKKEFPISIQFNLKNDDYNYTSLLSNGELLFEEIQNFIKNNSANDKADGEISSRLLLFKNVIIPASDKYGNEYTSSTYGAKLFKHLRNLDFDGKRLEFEFNVIGNTLNFTLK